MPKRKRYPTPLLSSDPAEKHEHSTPTRRAIQALDQAGHGRAEIESITHVQPRTQTRILESNTYHRPGRERDGRPCLLDQDTVEKMIKSLQGHYKTRTKSWDDLANDYRYSNPYWDEDAGDWKHPRLTITGKTVKRYLNEAGYHKCRACQKSWITQDQSEKRVDFCEAH